VKPRILVVDDEVAMCELIVVGLAKTFDVLFRTSPLEALEVAKHEPIEAVVTDIRMKGMSGTELCRALGECRPDLPVIVMTAFGSMESAIEAMHSGAYDYLPKPVQMDSLGFAIQRAVEARRLKEELRLLKRDTVQAATMGSIVGGSVAILAMKDLIRRVAGSDATILVTGESGTGKEVVARAIHEAGPRAHRPFVAVNCAAMPEALLESELFGHTKGAFTDAKAASPGLFVEAHGGTLLLDEIGDMPLSLQPKLLRALQERRIRPVGGSNEIPIDVRVIAATHRDLEESVAQKTFREDLYYRLNVVEIVIPPLRARGDDVLLLAQHFLRHFAETSSKAVTGMSPAVAERLRGYAWPGNVRELANCMERAVALTRFDELVVDDLPERVKGARRKEGAADTSPHEEVLPLEEIERRYILRVFDMLGHNRSMTAQLLGIDRKTLYRKLERWNSSTGPSGSGASSS